MIHAVWEFRIKPGREREFELEYGPSGAWARLFRQAAGYQRSELSRDTAEPGRYLVADLWESRDAFEVFRAERATEYESLDAACEELTDLERCLGWFEPVEPARGVV